MTHKIILGDCIEGMRTLANESVHCVVTSPPYFGLRDYGVDGQIGLEESPEEYVVKMVEVFREVRRILRNDGTVWLNLGDSYNGASVNRSGTNGYDDGRTNRDKRFSADGINGLKPKDLIGIPWRVAFALQSDGWWLRQDIIWHKPNPMPESVTDRCTKSHEYIFLLSKSERYYYDNEAIKEDSKKISWNSVKSFKTHGKHGKNEQFSKQFDGTKSHQDIEQTGRNKRSVWTVATKPYAEAHFATYPTKLIEPCILAGSPVGGVVFDPFTGSGTTALVALTNNRSYIGTELNPEYIRIAENRLSAIQPKMELV
jgi:DNA modification methylase